MGLALKFVGWAGGQGLVVCARRTAEVVLARTLISSCIYRCVFAIQGSNVISQLFCPLSLSTDDDAWTDQTTHEQARMAVATSSGGRRPALARILPCLVAVVLLPLLLLGLPAGCAAACRSPYFEEEVGLGARPSPGKVAYGIMVYQRANKTAAEVQAQFEVRVCVCCVVVMDEGAGRLFCAADFG